MSKTPEVPSYPGPLQQLTKVKSAEELIKEEFDCKWDSNESPAEIGILGAVDTDAEKKLVNQKKDDLEEPPHPSP